MGVFKNSVGRPSNETIKKRNIFKGICVLLVLIIIGLIAYILDDKGIVKLNVNKKDIKENKNITTKKSINLYEKYKNLEFVRSENLELGYEYQVGEYTYNTYYFELYISQGKIMAKSNDVNILFSDIDSKVKYIIEYNEGTFFNPEATIVILTEDNKAYLGKCILKNNELKYNFELISEKIIDMYAITNVISIDKNRDIYLLDNNGNLRLLNNQDLTNELFENRIVYLGNYDRSGPSIDHNLMVREKDNAVSFKKNLDEDEQFETIKYDNKQISVKEAFITEDYNSAVSVFFIDVDNNIYTTEKNMTEYISSKNISDDCYKIKLYSKEKVKDTSKFEEKSEQDITESYITVTFESGKKEKLKLLDYYKIDEYK